MQNDILYFISINPHFRTDAHALEKHEYMRILCEKAMEMNKVLKIYGHFYNEYGFL